MADFEIIEADFQQYYNLDISILGFQRYARLLANLPKESRFMQEKSPFKDWSWDKEVQAQILHSLDLLNTNYANAHRKKGTPPIKLPPLNQPDYVKKAKEKAKRNKKDEAKVNQQDLARIFKQHNNEVNNLENRINGA